ncbi:radical SAM protein [Eubacterium oxidoreducens]|uniref:Fe-S oxidoreductase n=1 Tax=Eubacterium oxidoreducens TaxID=1732 RepID=A0A1G6CA27_EUBOX|nr:radical SAM protein [Eubacterium oxidoreducens]SDB29641.1 Fe-S oxidoreductase [Eubacterium oxidoreducens]
MRYDGMIYRPPSEARSLIVQVTVGCAHNACTFCTMYKDKKFYIRPKEEILADFEEAYERYKGAIDRIFLADGDALTIPTEDMLEILAFIKERFPHARITSYGAPKDVLNKTPQELKAIADAGLSMIYMGAESGDDEVLRRICKGVTANEIVRAGQLLKEAGFQLSLTLISGLGGRERRKEHAICSAKLVTKIKPDYLGFLTLMLDDAAPIMKSIREGTLKLLKPDDVVEEMLLFLNEVDSDGTVFRANHASNYVPLKGTLNADKKSLIDLLKKVRKENGYRPESFRAL